MLAIPWIDQGPPRGLFAGLALALMGLIFWSSAGGTGELTRGLPGPAANLLHLPVGAVLGVLLLRALAPGNGLARASSWPGLGTGIGLAVVGIAVAHGVFNEIHQHLVPGRFCSLFDIVVDASGAVLVLLVPIREAAGRPRSWMPLVVVAVLAVALGIYAATVPSAVDRLLADAVDRLR